MVVQQVQHIGDIPGGAVLEGDDPVGGPAVLHGVKHLVKGGQAQGLRPGKQPGEGDVAVSPLGPLMGHHVPPKHVGLILAGEGHLRPKKVCIIGAQHLLGNVGGVFFNHLGLPAGVQNGHTGGLFVFNNLTHGGHALFKQRGHLPVHRVDLGTGLFQLVHMGFLPPHLWAALRLRLRFSIP